jgi:hypothetical protein
MAADIFALGKSNKDAFPSTLVSRLSSFGRYGVAVPHVGLSGTSDPAGRYAYENDLIVVTTNASGEQISPDRDLTFPITYSKRFSTLLANG